MTERRTKLSRRIIIAMPGPVRRAGKLVLRRARELAHPGHPPVFLNSIPKAGTHLLARLLDAAGYRLFANQPFNPNVTLAYDPGGLAPALAGMLRAEYVIEHLAWSAEAEGWLAERGFKILFIHRDPRAAAVSFAHYAAVKHPHHRLHRYFASLPTLDERVRAVLDGSPDSVSSNGVGRAPQAELYDAFRPWLRSPRVCSVAFEDLVGPRGGGTAERQHAAAARVLNHLELGLGEERVREIAGRVFNPGSVTFREARAGGWRDEVSPATLELLNSRLARHLSEWGCEP